MNINFITKLSMLCMAAVTIREPQAVEARMVKKTSEIEELGRRYSTARDTDEIEWAIGLDAAQEAEAYNKYYDEIQSSYRENLMSMFNVFERLALGLDACLKANNQHHVKYHLVSSAVYQAIYDLFKEEDIDSLRGIFGDVIDDQHTFHVMRSMVIDVVDGVRAEKTETTEILQKLQKDVAQAAGGTGNLYITHGDSPIKFASLFEIEKLRQFSPKIDAYLQAYALDLPAALNDMYTRVPLKSHHLYLVCHDYKYNEDEAIGYRLPRLGIVDIETGQYQEVLFDKTDPLQQANDLESLTSLRGNEYLTCDSNGKCYHLALDISVNEFFARTIKVIQLPVPHDKWFHIEGLTSVATDQSNYRICYDHRGSIFLGEEAWTRCVKHDLTHEIDDFDETLVEDPFAISDPLNNAIADHALGKKTGQSYFVATQNFKRIPNKLELEEEKDKSCSFIYTSEKCIKYFDKERVQALYINDDETVATIATDKDNFGNEKVCQFSLQNPEEPMACHTVQHGMGGIAPVMYSFFEDKSKINKQEYPIKGDLDYTERAYMI